MEPLLKGPAGLEYLGKAFAKRFGQPSDALTHLPLTSRWLSSLGSNYNQEWSDHKQTLESLQDGLPKVVVPSTALRTGGSFSNGLQTSSSVSNSITDADAAGNVF